MNGIVLVNKDKGMSSHDVIYKLRRIFKTKKIGHCGTLDPSATGVLVCLVNSATKLSNYLVLDTKEYIATFRLGQSTTTQDLDGEVVEEKTYNNEYGKEDILAVLNNFQGEIIQTPSIYSAIKVNGRKLYEYARANEPVEIPQRTINIFNIDLIDFKDDLVTIKVNCSSGTYIRTLCFDIAKELGYPGVLTSLVRTKSGRFNIEDSYTLEQLANQEVELLSISQALEDYDTIIVEENQLKDIKNGIPMKINTDKPFVVLDSDKNAIALYEASNEGVAKMKRGLW